MGLFGKDKRTQPKAAEPAANQTPADVFPAKAAYFDAVRTNAYENENLVANYVEFWVAMQVNKSQDLWRVMHYMVFDLDKPDGKFTSENVSKSDMSFEQAIYQMAKYDETCAMMQSNKAVEISQEQYPADKYTELKQYFFGIAHYRDAANIEGFAFDDAGQPYRRAQGKVFSNATFRRSEIKKSILAVEQARENPVIAEKIEGGILSDIFRSSSSRKASFDDILKIGESLGSMDTFAVQITAFYLGIQSLLKMDDKLDKIEGMTEEERGDIYRKAADVISNSLRQSADVVMSGKVYIETSSSELLDKVLPRADRQLDTASNLGIHVEPFKKFVAECELYAHLLSASQNLKQLEAGFSSASASDINLITSIRQSVDAAQKKFMDLGGSIEQVDKLKAWVADPKKELIPQWLPGFLSRYYDARRKVMQRAQAKQTSVAEVKTMSVKVKPPVIE